MYDYDKILKESLDRLFNEEFDKIMDKKQNTFISSHTLLNIPKITDCDILIPKFSLEEKNEISKYNNKKSFLKIIKQNIVFISVLILFCIIFLFSYSNIYDDIFSKKEASATKIKKLEYICDIISQGELNSTGNGNCSIFNNKIKFSSKFASVNDQVNYMVIISNNGSKEISIRNFKTINENDKINVNYKLFYNNKELISDNMVNDEKIKIEKDQSIIMIIEQKYNYDKEEEFDNEEVFNYNININY